MILQNKTGTGFDHPGGVTVRRVTSPSSKTAVVSRVPLGEPGVCTMTLTRLPVRSLTVILDAFGKRFVYFT
jgi:hypothetical protein